jgi:hypothetical protein
MKMKKFLLIILIIFIGLPAFVETIFSQSSEIHPRNKKLIQSGMIPPIGFFPEVPRVTAIEALSLYNAGRAIFIGIGAAVPRLSSGYILHNYMTFDPKRLKVPKDIIILTY